MKTPSFTRSGDHKLLWVTDPWSTLDHSNDTTLRLMHEAINMGIPTFWSATDQAFSSFIPGQIFAVELKKEMLPLDLSNPKLTPVALSSFQQIHYRVDPPVDEKYCSIIHQMLSNGAREEQILNPPKLIQNQSEKIPPKDLSEYTPRMIIIQNESDIAQLETFFAHDAELVSKPLHLAQSIGVKKHNTPQNRKEWNTLLKNLTQDFTQDVLLEEYLPEINQGEVRMWFAGETFIAALKKYPKNGDFRVLIDEGSKIAAHTLTTEEKSIAQKVGASLKNQGIFLAAIDLIGNKICDYNITSPGLLVQLEKVHGGKNFAKEILIQALSFRALKDL